MTPKAPPTKMLSGFSVTNTAPKPSVAMGIPTSTPPTSTRSLHKASTTKTPSADFRCAVRFAAACSPVAAKKLLENCSRKPKIPLTVLCSDEERGKGLGRYPHECVPGHEYQMPPSMPTLTNIFNDHGFDTAYFGKWHLDGHHERDYRGAIHIGPPERRGGFKTWVSYENNNSQWDSWVHGGEDDSAFHYRLPGYETDCLTDILINYIQQQAASRQHGRLPLALHGASGTPQRTRQPRRHRPHHPRTLRH